MNSLDFYAQIEEIIPFDDQINDLYMLHLKELIKANCSSLIDIGCGGGAFVELCNKNNIRAVGVDLSEQMVNRAQLRGINARCINICEIQDEKYNCASAVFDVLNYIPANMLDEFFVCVARLLESDGVFIADINTLHGFSDVADGDARFYDTDRELFVSAQFDGRELNSEFVLFQKQGELYKKSTSKITQYFHDKKHLKSIAGMKLEKIVPIRLFSNKPDKELLLFRKI